MDKPVRTNLRENHKINRTYWGKLRQAAVLFLSLLMLLSICGCKGKGAAKRELSEEEAFVLRDVKQLYNMMKNPDSFTLREDILCDSQYVIIDYSGTNSYGGTIRDTAVFKDHVYLGSLNDEFKSSDINDYGGDRDKALEAARWNVDIQVARVRLAQWKINGSIFSSVSKEVILEWLNDN